MNETSDLYVTASEIGEFVYCKRAWWLRFTGKQAGNPADLARGTLGHNKLFRKADILQRLKYFAVALIIISVFGLLLYFIISQFLWLPSS